MLQTSSVVNTIDELGAVLQYWNMVEKSVGPRVRALRERLEWTQEKLRKQAKVCRLSVWRLESGAGVELETFEKVARAMGVEPQTLRDKKKWAEFWGRDATFT